MSQFEFRIATPDDDASLRTVLASTPMEGRIRISFAREPSYFAATPVDGSFVQVVVACEHGSGKVVGMGSRAVSHCYVNGEPTRVGYLSALRLLPEYRGRAGLLYHGYQFFRDLHQDGRAPFYLTTIADDNALALRLLTSRRAGLPVYYPLGRYHTLVTSPAARRIRCRADLASRTATHDDGAQIAEFVCTEGARRQFFPIYAADEFFSAPRRLLGFRPEHTALVHRQGRLVGVLGAWDQSTWKQTVVSGYAPWLERTRWLYNGAAALSGRARLPPAGTALDLRYGAFGVAASSEEAFACRSIVEQLVETVCGIVAEQGCRRLLIGLHEDDPWLPWIRPRAQTEYLTRLFAVYWPEAPPDIEALKSRIPYLELGCL